MNPMVGRARCPHRAERGESEIADGGLETDPPYLVVHGGSRSWKSCRFMERTKRGNFQRSTSNFQFKEPAVFFRIERWTLSVERWTLPFFRWNHEHRGGEARCPHRAEPWRISDRGRRDGD